MHVRHICHPWPVRFCHTSQHYLTNGTNFFQKCYWAQNAFWFSLQLLSATFLILRSIEGNTNIMYTYRCSGTVPLFLADFNETWFFSKDFRKKIKYRISRKFLQWEAKCSMRTDGRTDMTKLTVAFRNFANAPKNSTFCPHSVFMCFVRISEQTAIIFLYSINWLVCITVT